MPRPTNYKTVLCKNFNRVGVCSYGKKCNFAHGRDELLVAEPKQFNKPCWYFNQGGCAKTANQCVYKHVKSVDMRKPRHIQHPCPSFHHQTPLYCRYGDRCGLDHAYELTPEEWMHHFPEVTFPGIGYLDEQKQLEKDFPMLGVTGGDEKPKGDWQTPLEIKEAYIPLSDGGECWADYPPDNDISAGINKLTSIVGKGDQALDGELKELVTAALRQLLEAAQ